MVALQILSKVIQSGDISLIEKNYLTSDYFVGYEDEYEFISNHYNTYGNVPDKATFLSHYPECELVEVQESDKYLLDTIKEEYLYYKSVPIIQKAADIMKSDAIAANDYMIQAFNELNVGRGDVGVDIISQSQDRFDRYKDRVNHKDQWSFSTGFQELDDIINGLDREEEFVVITARINQGKSWILEKITSHIWQIGFNVGYISPEMSASSVGYRFDTLYKNFSNKALMRGNSVAENEYQAYIDELKSNHNKFLVATPIDFNRSITVSKLKAFVKNNGLDMLAIDGIKYLTDERAKRNDNLTIALTNISEDLMSLSMELHIPIVVVVQSNRGGVKSDEDAGTPDLENIRDSDGIAANASKVLAIRQLKNGVLEIGIKKQRFGAVGGKLNYNWDIDIGDFTYCPSYDDATSPDKQEKSIKKMKKKYETKEDVF